MRECGCRERQLVAKGKPNQLLNQANQIKHNFETGGIQSRIEDGVVTFIRCVLIPTCCEILDSRWGVNAPNCKLRII